MPKPEKLYSVMYGRSTLRLLFSMQNYDDKDLISVRVSDAMCRKTDEKDYNATEKDMKWGKMTCDRVKAPPPLCNSISQVTAIQALTCFSLNVSILGER
jgi:hypothetical protein